MKKYLKYWKLVVPIIVILAALANIVHIYLTIGIGFDLYRIVADIKSIACAFAIAIAVWFLLMQYVFKKPHKRGKRILVSVVGVIVTGGLLALAVTYGGSTLYKRGVMIHFLDESMDVADYAAEWEYDSSYHCYVLDHVVYVQEPVSKTYQSMTIVVPEAYMNQDGTMNDEGTINGYTAQTAPIIYQNGVSGYAESISSTNFRVSPEYLESGYIYVCVGSRGRASQTADGSFCGRAPAALVDLKAGTRFLKLNDAVLAGDSNRIISVGTSAGGAMSSLLASTGNSSLYDPYLEEIGAIMTETDDVYASMCYCPVTNLENADAAYEWMFLNNNPDADDFNLAVSKKLAEHFVSYVNALELVDPVSGEALSLDSAREGSLYDYLMGLLEESAAKYLSQTADPDQYTEKYGWLSYDGATASITALDQMLTKEYNDRMKATLAFDAWDLSTRENEEFGTTDGAPQHFNASLAETLEELAQQYPDQYSSYYDGYAAVSEDAKLQERIYLLNPMNFVGSDEVTTAPHVRIRVGTKDADTSFMISLTLALKLAEYTDVDMAYVWDQPHTEADYPGEFTAWVDEICK